MELRKEKDSLGVVFVPKDAYWGAQTGRSLQNFAIGQEKMPWSIIEALLQIKKAAAIVNYNIGDLEENKKRAIVQAIEEVLTNKLTDQFPLSVWQTGSGTQTNMNVNEVVARKASFLLNAPVHPNDDVNKSQSSNDTFPTAIHIAAYKLLQESLLPALHSLKESLSQKKKDFLSIIKVGRTHLMDAVPISLGQEFSGYEDQITKAIRAIEMSIEFLEEVPIGGTAVGTGLNAKKGFKELVIQELKTLTGLSLIPAKNPFSGLSSKDACVHTSSSLRLTATNLFKIANDIRWMASGPRCGLQELFIPENEPGSSIMPGKVNPTQCEAILMVSTYVFGLDSSIGFAASQGNFELNIFMPLIGYALIQSITLLSDSVTSFTKNCVNGITPNTVKIDEYNKKNLMVATALTTRIGYEQAAKVVQKAHKENISLKEAVQELGILSEEEFDSYMDLSKMAFPKDA